MLVTDRRRSRRPLAEAVAAAVAGGVGLVQLREKDLSPREVWAWAERLRELTRGRALLVINGHADVAVAVGADGVHLGSEGRPVAAARAVVGPERLIGRSVHRVEEAIAAEQEGADYLVVGTIFATASHPDQPPAGLSLLRAVRAAVSLPLFAIGGITAANAPACRAAGAHGVAVIGNILEADDPQAAAAALKQAVEGET
jgi:thiamine-phosphate pyrophosphorylase